MWLRPGKRFNPRPAHVGGATRKDKHRHRPPIAFQSAPRPRGRGDPSRVPPPHGPGLFQSAPRPRGRGDPKGPPSQSTQCRFNPRPAHVGGATARRSSLIFLGSVSIRAPPTWAGRREDAEQLAQGDEVSIRAPPTWAGRPQSAAQCIEQSRFNPRPAHVGGATRPPERQAPPDTRFNPRPAHVGGATPPPSSSPISKPFQSAPRPRGRGDGGISAPLPPPRRFNPRPAHVGGATPISRSMY